MVHAALGLEGEHLASARARPATADRLRGLVDQHFDVIWRALRRLGVEPGAVDDGAQQVFLVASRKLATIDPATERAYLLGIAVRVAADARRTQRRRREVPDSEDPPGERASPVPNPEDLVDQKRARELLDDVLAELPEELREVFVLFEIEGLVAPKIAEILGIPGGTVASRIRRARELFQARVERRLRASATSTTRRTP